MLPLACLCKRMQVCATISSDACDSYPLCSLHGGGCGPPRDHVSTTLILTSVSSVKTLSHVGGTWMVAAQGMERSLDASWATPEAVSLTASVSCRCCTLSVSPSVSHTLPLPLLSVSLSPPHPSSLSQTPDLGLLKILTDVLPKH